MNEPDIFIVTGEASGDAVGGKLAEHLRGLRPDITIQGIGARRMREAGVDLTTDSSQWAAIGVVQALPMLFKLLRLQRTLKRRLLEAKPKALVLVDFGAFNVPLGTWARQNGIRTVYLMPSGSWRRTSSEERLRKMAASADLFLSPFAWNAENLRSVGADAVHIGHPALELSATASDWRPGPTAGRRIALLPGSRRHEVETLAPVLTRVARDWPFPDDRFTMVRAPSYPEEELYTLVDSAVPGGRSESPNLEIVAAGASEVFRVSDLAVACSGTATLEAAIAGVPMVVVYDGPALMRLEWRIRKKRLNVVMMAIPNIIAQELIVPELRAEDVSVENITAALMHYIDEPQYAAETRDRLRRVRAELEPEGALETAASRIVEIAGL